MKWALLFVFLSLTTISLGMIWWIGNLKESIQTRLAQNRWSAPVEYYSAPPRFVSGQLQIQQTLEETLENLEYSLSDNPKPHQFSKLAKADCQAKFQVDVNWDAAAGCIYLKSPESVKADDPQLSSTDILFVIGSEDNLLGLFQGNPLVKRDAIELEPELFAQFYGDKPLLRKIVDLGDVPSNLLNGIMAIEDSEFLKHKGVSPKGLTRVFFKFLTSGRFRQGGSTITQQLIKNYFLTPERTFKRKFTEIIMALILEEQISKDQILETYVNEIYFGQEGPFEVHGVALAAKFRFGKKLEDLTLAECAQLAGTIQSPNVYSPPKNMERTLKRRNEVLSRMLTLGLITQEEYDPAVQAQIPIPKETQVQDVAPYFVDAVRKEITRLGINPEDGLQVYTTLNRQLQTQATKSVLGGLQELEKKWDFVQKNEKKYGQKLQGLLISADVRTGRIDAVVGGRSYGQTQLNRPFQSTRQIGSVFKPFVYLTAFSLKETEKGILTPLTKIMDEPFTHKYEGQKWSPQNYDGKFFGEIPLYMGLQESLNSATSRLALDIGLEEVLSQTHLLGIEAKIPKIPSVVLGSFELTPAEVLQAYLTLSRMGEKRKIFLIEKITNGHGQVLYQDEGRKDDALDPVAVRQTVSLMENVVNRGTGRSIRLSGFTKPAAGKTGTTSDLKDTWFSGFTPNKVTVVWVGYDQPQKTGFTGALGALPIWINYMTYAEKDLPNDDFPLPENAVKVWIDPQSNMLATEKCPDRIQLVFRKGTEPTTPCTIHN